MSGFQGQSSDADIDIGQLFAAIWRDKLRILTGALIVTVLTLVALSLVSPKYTAETKLLIDANESVFTRPSNENQQVDRSTQVDLESVASQVEVINSSDLLLSVAEQLGLEGREEFNSASNPSALKMGMIALGLVSDPSSLPADQRILDAIRERLTVYAVAESRVIVIEFESADRELAAQFPNELAKAYSAIESRAQLQNTGEAAEYLAVEIEQLEKGIRDAEARVADFRAESGLLVGDNNEVLVTQQLAELSTELSRVRAERSSIEGRVRSVEQALQNGSSLDTLPDVINSPLIERLKEQEIQLNAEIADLSTTLLPGHPRIRALRSQLGDLRAQIRNQARNVLEGLRNQAATERSREAELIADVNNLKAASTEANSKQVELRALERVAASQRDLLESYLIRFREARSRDETEYAPPNARIISTATTPIEASFPKMMPMLAAAFLGSMLVMIMVTLVRELLSGRALVPAARSAAPAPTPAPIRVNKPTAASETGETFATRSSVGRKIVGPAILAKSEPETPLDELAALAPDAPDAALAPEQASAANDNYSVAALTDILIQRGSNRAIVVSPEGDTGSICTVELVRSLADEGLRAVLVDLTGTAASSQHMLADFTLPGITELLAAQAPYAEVIHADAATRAHVIPTGNADPSVAMRAVDRLPIIMNALSAAYDIVIADCGPTDAAGLKRLTSEDTAVIMAMVEPDSGQVVRAAEDLIAGGYNDVLIVTGEDMPLPPSPDRQFA